MKLLHIDGETYSAVELTEVGLHNYMLHPSTILLMLAWAFGDEEVQIWFPHEGPMPQRLKSGLGNPDQKITSFNSAFERYFLNHLLGYVIPASRFQDPQASARYLSLPASLEAVGEVLKLPREMTKDKAGETLMNIFSFPTVIKKTKKVEGRVYRRDHLSDPDDWARYALYCKQDVIAEREIANRLSVLKVFPLPDSERRIWIFDQAVNDRGLPVNLRLVEKAYQLANREKQESLEEMNRLTGLENANSRDQILAWVRDRGYQANSMKKETVEAALKYDPLTELAKQVLLLRKSASSTTYKKLSTITKIISPDHRLRNQFIYMGSSRCGRWSGNGFQFHNMARPSQAFEDLDTVDKARAMILAEDYDGIKREFKSVLLTVKNCIRTIFQADETNRLNVCDLNAIETRVAAWVSGCESLLDVFRKGRDPYLDFAVKMTGISYEQLWEDLHSKNPTVKAAAKKHRQDAKPAVLGCIYRLGGGQMGVKKGDPVKQGYWGYAENMGVEITQEKAHETVRIVRESYPEIVQMWYDLEEAVKDVLAGSRTKRELGPNGCIKIDKLNRKDSHPILRIQLPSGRYLHYIDARIEPSLMPWKKVNEDTGDYDIPVFKEGLVYSGINQITKQWASVTSNGGKLLENIVQGIARDILAASLVRFEFEYCLPVCGHVHDEALTETDNSPMSPGLLEMEYVMGQSIDWAPGLPLKADGFESNYYHK